MQTLVRTLMVLALAAVASAAAAQQTTGTIAGRVVDEQDRAVPGATVTATSAATGFVREAITDEAGVYRLQALPVDRYGVTITLQGFARVEHAGVVVNIGGTTSVDAALRVAGVAETVTVSGAVPLVSRTSSGVGQVVDLEYIEGLPLNGRQFANLAVIVPGVGLGTHSDVSKSTQFTPQVSGGNGRNVNYQVDGGDNNDDTTGGLLQLFPLESIQEFNVMTQRFSAEYGRSNGAVINVVTRSGTNMARGSWFTLLRDDALNARTFSESLAGVDKQAYRRYQYGGSFGGPVVLDRVHYFAAFERIQQNTRQAVSTLGLFPEADGVYDTPYRETMLVGKLTAVLSGTQHLAVRYGANQNTQPNNAGPRTAPESWSTSRNRFDSVNVNHNWVVGSAGLNEVVVQFSRFDNEIPGDSTRPALLFPNGVRAGANPIAPQATEQQKWQIRDDLSRAFTGGFGLGHDLKGGVNWIHEPRLFISTSSLFGGQYTLAANAVNAPVRDVMVIGGAAAVNMPFDQVGLYAQDDWRVSSRLTLNLGVRWDYTSGLLNQDGNPNFRIMQDAGRAGRFAGTPLAVFGQEPRNDLDNVQPRLGAVYDLGGNGRDIVRAGWGIYTDFGYTNSNILTAAIDAVGGAGVVFAANNPAGLRRSDGEFFTIGDPLSSIAGQNLVNPAVRPLAGHVVSPRLEQPYTRQSNVGYTRELAPGMALSVDYVRTEGRDLNVRYRPNVLVNGRRALADLGVQPNSLQFRTAVNAGRSEYDALILALRRRANGLDLNAWYTLSSSRSNVGPASDELDSNLVQDVRDPFGEVQNGPSARTDARHRVTVSAIVALPGDIQVAPLFTFRSALPLHTIEGIDVNGDGNLVDRTAMAYRYTGLDEAGVATFEEDGPCETVNCSRRAPFSQLNLRVSRRFAVGGRVRLEAIGEVFNLFNAVNPVLPLTTIRRSAASPALASFMQPTAFAGDFQQSEQRIGQIGIRLSF